MKLIKCMDFKNFYFNDSMKVTSRRKHSSSNGYLKQAPIPKDSHVKTPNFAGVITMFTACFKNIHLYSHFHPLRMNELA